MTPSQKQIDIALLWLESNEGEDGGEREACLAVADYLQKHFADKMIREEARKAGIPVAAVRKRMRTQSQHDRQEAKP